MTETDEKLPQTEEPLSPRKKRAMLEYMGIMFAVAFLLVALSLLVKMHAMQDDMDAANNGARENIEAMEEQLETLREENATLQGSVDAAVRSARAAELLALAQDAQHARDEVAFKSYMAELEGCADALSPEAQALYTALAEKLS